LLSLFVPLCLCVLSHEEYWRGGQIMGICPSSSLSDMVVPRVDSTLSRTRTMVSPL
jgi:hypothetical protein